MTTSHHSNASHAMSPVRPAKMKTSHSARSAPTSSPTSSLERPIALSLVPAATSRRRQRARVRLAKLPATTARATPSSVLLVIRIASSQSCSTTSVLGHARRATQRSMACVPPVPLPVRPALALQVSACPATAHWREGSCTPISAIATAL